MDQLQAARPSVEIEIIEVLKHPARVLQDRIFTIPTLVVGSERWHSAPELADLIATLDGA